MLITSNTVHVYIMLSGNHNLCGADQENFEFLLFVFILVFIDEALLYRGPRGPMFS